jgi:DNA-binding MarR family transcriptional regulator
VLGVGRPLEDSGNARFAGWNFDVQSTGEIAADWISAHPHAVREEHLISVSPSTGQIRTASEERSSDALLERAKSILRVRRARERQFCRSMLGEPAFDLLLLLYLRSGQKGTSLIGLARAAGVPSTSATRWARYLADKGFIECAESQRDRRAMSIQLTSSGRAVMEEFLAFR